MLDALFFFDPMSKYIHIWYIKVFLSFTFARCSRVADFIGIPDAPYIISSFMAYPKREVHYGLGIYAFLDWFAFGKIVFLFFAFPNLFARKRVPRIRSSRIRKLLIALSLLFVFCLAYVCFIL